MEYKLSIVIACYNEELRIPQTLEKITFYLEKEGIDYEIILVNDGSTDNTEEIISKAALKNSLIKKISRPNNLGRGASIRQGFLSAKGEYILETDADSSVDFEAIKRFMDFFAENSQIDLVVGSRRIKGSKIIKGQPWFRQFAGHIFILLFRIICPFKSRDYTLGFKMLRHKASKAVFQHQYDNGFVAEAEIIYSASKLGYKIKELPVIWTNNKDSRVRFARDIFKSLRAVFRILILNFKGAYKING